MFTFDAFWGRLGTISLGTQVQSEITLEPDYLLDYLSVSYDYEASLYSLAFWQSLLKLLKEMWG